CRYRPAGRAGLRRAAPTSAAWRPGAAIDAESPTFQTARAGFQAHPQSSNPESLPCRFRAAGAETECFLRYSLRLLLLIGPGFGHRHGHLAHPLDHADALGHADRAPRIQRIKQVGALEHVIVGGEQWKARLLLRFPIVERDQPGGFAFMQVEKLPEG